MDFSVKSLETFKTIINRDNTTIKLNFVQDNCILEGGDKLQSIKIKTKISHPVSIPFSGKVRLDLLIDFYKSFKNFPSELMYELGAEKDKEYLKISFNCQKEKQKGEYNFNFVNNREQQIYQIKPFKTWQYFEASSDFFEALQNAKSYCRTTGYGSEIIRSVNVAIANQTIRIDSTNAFVICRHQLSLTSGNFEGDFQIPPQTIQLIEKANIQSAIFLIDTDVNGLAIQSLNNSAIVAFDHSWKANMPAYPDLDKICDVAASRPGFQVRSNLLRKKIETIKADSILLSYNRPKLTISNSTDETVLVDIPPVNDCKTFDFRVDRKILLSVLKGKDKLLTIKGSDKIIEISSPNKPAVFYMAVMREA